jgi:hypothetical protein
MTKTHTGLCGLKGCPDPVDWDVGPGLCHGHWQAFQAWKGLNGYDRVVGTIPPHEEWLEAEKLEVGA